MSSALPHDLEAEVARAWPPSQWRDLLVVLGVSGGADSVALLRAIVALDRQQDGRGSLRVAHFNHQLRGPAADADQAWVADLCRELEVPLEVGRADVLDRAAEQGDGLEAAARDARYEFFIRTAERLGARFVAVAHTADDQVETVLHHIVRGTGLKGLAGIPRIRRLSPSLSLVRPLLDVTRDEVLRYLLEIGQNYCCDASNDDTQYTRNRLRHDLLPLLRAQYNRDVDRVLARLAQQADEVHQAIAPQVEQLVRAAVAIEPATRESGSADAVRISSAPLADVPVLIVREVCRAAWTAAGWPLGAMGFDQWQQLAELIGDDKGEQPAVTLPGGVRAERQPDALHLSRPTADG